LETSRTYCEERGFDDQGNTEYDDYKQSFSAVYENLFWREMGIVIFSGVVWILFLFDNYSLLRSRHIWVITDFVQFVLYVGAYCPLHPLYQYFVVPVACMFVYSVAVVVITAKVSRAVSMTVISSLHPVGNESEPTTNPAECNDKFGNE
jgi:hypothetical protein